MGQQSADSAAGLTSPLPDLSTEDPAKVEFYSTYDVMTGVRIAATLGGFFSLMVLLVVYKSKCKSRSLSDENLEAAAAAAAVVEDSKAFSVYGGGGRQPRFSVTANYPLLVPPRGRVSLPYLYPSPYLARPPLDSPPPDAYLEEEELDNVGQNLLQVPSSRGSSRRLSSVTCSSCDTSYLERRGSALEMGLPIPPPFASKQKRLVEESWDFYYPIDIQVIQPTPEVSPCQSQNSVFECSRPGLVVPAPLASISSIDDHSIGSDSVFLDEELVDTEDEVEGFSTDSDAENMDCVLPSTKRYPRQKRTHSLPKSVFVPTEDNRVPVRRFSSPSPNMKPSDNRLGIVPEVNEEKYRSCNEIVSAAKTSSESDTVCADECAIGRSVSFISPANMSISCDQLVKALQQHTAHSGSAKSIVEHCTWSQETLF